MADDKAVIRAELDGTAEVQAQARKLQDALRQAEKDAKKTADEVAKGGKDTAQVATGLDGLAAKLSVRNLLGATLGGAVLGTVGAVMSYLGKAADSAQQFGERTAQGARRAGVDLSALRTTVARNELATLHGADAQLDLVISLQRTTYNGRGAVDSLRSIGMAATASGRDLAELVPVVASLQDGLNVRGDVGDELGRITHLARELKTIGGPVALQDTIASLRPALQQVSIEGARARGEMLGLVAVLAQDRKPGQAGQVASAAIGFVKSNAVQIEYSLHQAGLLKKGEHVLNAQGNVRDELGTIEALQKLADRKYGKGDSQAKYNAVIAQYGPDLGSAMLQRNLTRDAREAGLMATGQAGQVLTLDPTRPGEYEARTVQPTEDEAEVARLQRTPEGRRKLREIRAGQRERKIGETALGVRDAVGEARDAVGEAAVSSPQLTSPGPLGRTLALDHSDRSALAKETGRAVADALREAPQTITLPRDPNAPRGN